MQGNRLALLLSQAHRQHWSHHIHFTPQTASHGANDASVGSLITCTPARALLSATTLHAWEEIISTWWSLAPAWKGHLWKGLIHLAWISKTSLAHMSWLLHGFATPGAWHLLCCVNSWGRAQASRVHAKKLLGLRKHVCSQMQAGHGIKPLPGKEKLVQDHALAREWCSSLGLEKNHLRLWFLCLCGCDLQFFAVYHGTMLFTICWGPSCWPPSSPLLTHQTSSLNAPVVKQHRWEFPKRNSGESWVPGLNN